MTARKTENSFIDDLMDEYQRDRTYTVSISIDPYQNGWTDAESLVEILGISKNRLSADAQITLEFLESNDQNIFRDEWVDFKRKLIAYREIQDIFPLQLYPESSPLTPMKLWYFYYEADFLMKDSLLAGLHYCSASSVSILRPFLEFSVLQLYFYRVCNAKRNFERLEEYHRTERHPGWHAALKSSMPNDNFCKPIRRRAQVHLDDLSNHASHPYGHSSSPRNSSYAPGIPNMSGIVFWRFNKLVLEAALWIYYVNFPMLFKPTNVYRKFGCNRPIGNFADEVCSGAVSAAMPDSDFNLFREYSRRDHASELEVQWIEEQEDLTELELRKGCDEDFKGTADEMYPAAYVLTIAKSRTLRSMLSLDMESLKIKTPSDNDDLPDISIHDFSRWRHVYKKI
ncbi:MAG: hypothetical protein V3U65_18200 [Granulosicoccaceae bacterium]